MANTKWIVAVCTYTGDNTKIMLNSQKGRVKMSHLEGRINKLVIYIVLVQLVICSFIAVCTQVWQTTKFFDDYVLELPKPAAYYTTLSFGSYFVLLNTLLPISLSVSLEVCKVVQGYIIGEDVAMYSWERDK